MVLDVAGPVSSIEKTFHVVLRTYQHPYENRIFYSPDVEPALDFKVPILHVSGMDNYLLPQPSMLKQALGSSGQGATDVPATGSGVPSGSFIGGDYRAAYIPGSPLTGEGQTVGLLEFDGYYPGDITNYNALAGLSAIPLTNVLLDGFSGSPGGANSEVALDIDMAASMAPGLSQIMIYEGTTPDDILNQMATDDAANQLSSAWLFPIDGETEQIFQEFAAQGQSFFNSSGDFDAWVGEITTPCDDPNITIVGGTTLTTTGPGGAWDGETVWNWDVELGSAFDGTGSGGGISETYTIPSWQAPVDMSRNQGSTTLRNIPDVALAADNIFIVADNGQFETVGGTSCAVSLWGGFAALVNQQAAANGRAPLGFMNPALYALGLSADYSNTFHDITTGSNTWSESPTLFSAVAGYDLCTGWGTPAGTNLVNLLAPDSMEITPRGGLLFSGAAGGPLTPASQSFSMTNGGITGLTWGGGSGHPLGWTCRQAAALCCRADRRRR